MQRLLSALNQFPKANHQIEIIVVDGGSTDNTVKFVQNSSARLYETSHHSRAIQMNFGAAQANGDILYFLHADTMPPPSLYDDINKAINEGYDAGTYRVVFDLQHWFLTFNAWFSQFDVDAFRYGDQSLFVKKSAFINIDGFKKAFIIFEDNDIVCRLKRHGKFKLMQKSVTTSARKYVKYGVYRLQLGYYLLYFLYKFGASQKMLLRIYSKVIAVIT